MTLVTPVNFFKNKFTTKNLSDLSQSQECPLAKVGWIFLPQSHRGDAPHITPTILGDIWLTFTERLLLTYYVVACFSMSPVRIAQVFLFPPITSAVQVAQSARCVCLDNKYELGDL